jgi:hypothetical protein
LNCSKLNNTLAHPSFLMAVIFRSFLNIGLNVCIHHSIETCRIVEGWIRDHPLEVALSRNGDYVVLWHLDITLDCCAIEDDLIVVQEVSYEL